MPLRPLPALEDNYIWCLEDGAGGAIVVDPGDATPVLEATAAGLHLHAVLLTHHHGDHINGIKALRSAFPALPVFAPEDRRIAAATERVGDGGTVRSGSWRFDVLATPGHTQSHVTYVGAGALFCGDTLFSLGCGRLIEGTPAQMLASLERLAELPSDLAVCCGHEYTLANAAFALTVDPDSPALRRRCAQAQSQRQHGRPTVPSTLATERETNPFLRIDDPAVSAAIARHLGHAPADRIEAFAALRRWKDGFRA